MLWSLETDSGPFTNRKKLAILVLRGVLLSLPPNIRYKDTYNFLFGYCIGAHQPNMQMLLKPFIKDFNIMFEEGVRLVLQEQTITSRSILYFFSADNAMLKCIKNISGHGSICGCDVCKQLGQTVEYSENDKEKRAVKYFTEKDTAALRTDTHWKASVKRVEANKQKTYNRLKKKKKLHAEILNSNSYSSKAVNGIKGGCVVMDLKYLSWPLLTPVQFMHCIYEK